MADIEVRVHQQGTVVGDDARADASMACTCDLCGQSGVDSVVSVGATGFACADCLRGRLEAMSVARWRLKTAGQAGLPWGKLTS